jgi:hypothetical protein
MPTESEKKDSNGSEDGGGGALGTKSVLITAGVAIAVFVIAVGLPLWSGKNLEIKLDYALTAAVAAAICLLLTGQINKLVLGKEGVTIEIKKAILRSANAPIKEQVVEVPVTPIEEAEKMGVGQIDLLISRRIKALDFVVGSERYTRQAVRTYLEKLSDFDDFRFVILLKSDRTFLGIIDARKLLGVLRDPRGEVSFDQFTTIVNQGDRASLAKFPGLIPVEKALDEKSDKREALQKMEDEHLDWIPVVDKMQFKGIVERSRLLASMILDVTSRLERGK